MRLVTYGHDGELRLGAVWDEWIIDLNRAYRRLLQTQGEGRPDALATAHLPPDMLAFLNGGERCLQAARETLAIVASADLYGWHAHGLAYPIDKVTLKAPLPRPGSIIGVGLNYADHAREAGLPIPEEPIFFAKFGNAVSGPYDPIIVPRVSTQVDYEVELAVIIGRPGKHIAAARAYEYVAGYCVANDVSARDWQMRTSQWLQGKTFDTFLPLGPALVTGDEIADPQALPLSLSIGQQILQDSNTSRMVFPVAEIIARISQLMSLQPGDIILTGTPPGVGMAQKPPRWLRPGDVVEAEIDGLGRLKNPVVAEEA